MVRYQSLALASCSLWASKALAGFNPGASDNIAIYWGQNSAGVTDAGKSQQSLSEYCSSSNVDIIPISFLYSLDPAQVDLANMGSQDIGKEIKSCQEAGKTIMLSIGGATFNTHLPSESEAQTIADQVWSMFGPTDGNSNAARPFGDAVVDGFDLDIEAPIQNIAPFTARLRENMDKASGAGGQKFYLSAAPQCPFPDQNNLSMLQGDGAIAFDFVMVQFYNNPTCDMRVFSAGGGGGASGSSSQSSFNMDVWDEWARGSKNPATKIFLGIPAGESAVGASQKASYKGPQELAPVIAYSKTFQSFGGVMMWDMSQVWANPGFLDAVAAGVKGSSAPASGKRAPQADDGAKVVARSHQRDWTAM
ncbi:Chitinase 2 [Parahypoxylon ruwenzoriense]